MYVRNLLKHHTFSSPNRYSFFHTISVAELYTNVILFIYSKLDIGLEELELNEYLMHGYIVD